MAFIEIPGFPGKIYEQDEQAGKKKHNCPDCQACLMCSDIRCELCLAHKKCSQCSADKKADEATGPLP